MDSSLQGESSESTFEDDQAQPATRFSSANPPGKPPSGFTVSSSVFQRDGMLGRGRWGGPWGGSMSQGAPSCPAAGSVPRLGPEPPKVQPCLPCPRYL